MPIKAEQEAKPCPNCMGFGWEPSVYDGRRPCGFCADDLIVPAQLSRRPCDLCAETGGATTAGIEFRAEGLVLICHHLT